MKEKTIREVFPKDPNKTYGLMALVEGTAPAVEKEPEDTEFTWPHLVYRELIYALFAMAIFLLISLLFNAPLQEIADPMHPPNPAKAPWYFVGLQELVHYSAFIGGILVPLLLVIGLML
ncbi:MAG: menaquinol oxidoreductase, partial [bacterium]